MASIPTPSGSSDSNGTPGAEEGTRATGEVHELDLIEAGLDALERALQRLDDGAYWTCEECGGPLDQALLDDDPTTRRCSSHLP